jgi:outer membrane protein TolC
MSSKLKKMKHLIRYILVAALMLGFNPSFAQKVMTLDDCRNQAVEFNKELKKANLEAKESKVNQEVARTAYLPGVSASASLMHSPKDVDLSVMGMGSLDGLTLAYGGLSASQPVYVGGKIRNSNKQADLGVEIYGYSYELKYSEIIESTDNAFWQVVKVQENIKIAEEYIKMLTELEDQMSAMYEVGLQPASEKLKVSVQKNQAELNLIKAKNGLKVAKMYLNQTLGQALETDVQVAYDTTMQTQLIDLNDGVKLAGQNRNELKILGKQKEISELNAKITRSDYLPTVGVSAQYTTFWLKDLYEDTNFTLMLAGQVSIPVFHWGQGLKKQRAAQLKVEQAQTELDNTNDLINLEVMQVKVQVEEAYETVLLAQKNVEEAEESLSETKASFDVGLNATSDMLSAQAQWQEAKAQLSNAIADYNVVKTGWQRVTGQIAMQ